MNIWRDVVSGTFVVFMLCIGALLLLLTAVSIVDAAGQHITFGEYYSVLYNYVRSRPIAAKYIPVVGALSQPLILGASVVVLAYPTFQAFRDARTRKSAIVEVEVSEPDKNRRHTSEVLAKEFKEAGQICIVSGDFSWLAENQYAKDALFAIIERHHREHDHIRVISYKTKEEISEGLRNQAQGSQFTDITDAKIAEFVDLVAVKPHLKNIKMTISNRHGERRLYLVAGATYAEEEQFVKIKDREYGRQLINIFDHMFEAAVDAPVDHAVI